MTDISEIRKFLSTYTGPDMNIMEICGSHTAAIAKNGIRSILSKRIHLISGPGCPVCVTPTAYIDRAIELACTEQTCLVTFGDLMRVPGSTRSLAEAKGEGAQVRMVYSPMDVLELAEKEPSTTFVFAAIGFETTTPVYALLVDTLVREKRKNVKLLTALKTMPPVICTLMGKGADIHGFLAPGHVSVVIGSSAYEAMAEDFEIPFGIAGFTGEEILKALYGIVKARGQGKVMNFYPSVVRANGNPKAMELTARYFRPGDAVWRGIGRIPGSGMILKNDYAELDAGSLLLTEDKKSNEACCCEQVLTGRLQPKECPLFGKVCTPLSPQGACMVSEEGACNSAYHYAE